MQRLVVSIFCLFFLPSSLSAQAPAAPVRVPGETIVVTADRLAEPLEDATDSVSVITAEDLARSQAVTVEEALRDVAGISILRSGSTGHQTSAFLRGANSSQVLLLVDGVEVNDPFFGSVDIGALLTSGVERIEIVRGAQSPLYGSQAMAGVINVVTSPRDTLAKGAGATVHVEGGSLSTHRELLQRQGGSDALQWKLGAAHFRTAGQFDNDEFRNLQLNGRAQWQLTAGSTLALHGFAAGSQIGIAFNGAAPSPRRESESRVALGALEYILHASPLLNLEVRTGLTDRDDTFTDPDDLFSQSSATDSQLWRSMAQNTMTLGVQTITFGIEDKTEDIHSVSSDAAVLDETIRTTAGYVQDKIELGALRVTAGARLDRHSRFGSHTSPRLSAAYQVSEGWRVRAAVGRAFRSPSAGELAYPFYGNPALDPEISRSYEAGIDWTASRASLALTGFSTNYDDLITFDPVTFVAGNIDRATIRGAEVTASAWIGHGWRADAAYTHLQTRDTATGQPLYRRPRHSGALTLSYARDVWSVSANANAVGSRRERDFETFTDRDNPGYVKFDAAGSYRLRPAMQLTARIENLFDREYEEILAFPAAGRTFHAGVQFGF